MLPRRSKKRIALKKLPIIIKCKRKDVISYITLNMYLYQNNHYIVSTDTPLKNDKNEFIYNQGFLRSSSSRVTGKQTP